MLINPSGVLRQRQTDRSRVKGTRLQSAALDSLCSASQELPLQMPTIMVIPRTAEEIRVYLDTLDL